MSTRRDEAWNFVKGVTRRPPDRHFTFLRAVTLSHGALMRQVPVTFCLSSET